MKTQTTIHSRIAGRARAIPALLLVVALGGCAATHVDDTWQCPLAQGTACTRVAEADPAVTAPVKTQPAKRDLPDGASDGEELQTAPGCVRTCDPLAWFVGLFKSGGEQGGIAAPPGPEPVSEEDGTLGAAQERLRTKERIARIWIAPFVDAAGVYREGHWVRAVLEPSRWRLR